MENKYINVTITGNAIQTWFIKKNGTNWGMFIIMYNIGNINAYTVT